MRIERFYEMFEGQFDYDRIVTIMKKKYGWGLGVINFTEDFESNSEYFLSPKDDRQYAEQFNIFLSDMENGYFSIPKSCNKRFSCTTHA